MKILTREEVLAKRDMPKETVDCPELGGAIIISTMDGERRNAWEQGIELYEDEEGKKRTRRSNELLVVFCAEDEKGNLLFKPADISELTKLNSAPIWRLSMVAQRLNGIGTTAVKEAEKN